MPAELQDILGRYLQRSHYSAGQLAARSGVPKRTIINWQTGRVSKPHQWQGLVQIAAVVDRDHRCAGRRHDVQRFVFRTASALLGVVVGQL